MLFCILIIYGKLVTFLHGITRLCGFPPNLHWIIFSSNFVFIFFDHVFQKYMCFCYASIWWWKEKHIYEERIKWNQKIEFSGKEELEEEHVYMFWILGQPKCLKRRKGNNSNKAPFKAQHHVVHLHHWILVISFKLTKEKYWICVENVIGQMEKSIVLGFNFL